MKILIVEDQKEKSEDIVKFFGNYLSSKPDISIKYSLQSGLKDLVTGGGYDLIILDMSMPNFDPSFDDPIGGTPESFAGSEFLSQMKLREISIPVMVVTQYAVFANGLTLEDLDQLFKFKYSDIYLGSVYYSSASDAWKDSLTSIIEKLNYEK